MRVRHRYQRRGATVVLVTLSLVVILAFSALAIDGSNLVMHRIEYQRSVDAAALAGVSQLPNEDAAIDASEALLSMNEQRRGGALEFAQIEVGLWEPGTETFAPWETPFNAVRVHYERPATEYFASVLGHQELSTKASAIAYKPSGIMMRFLIDEDMINNGTDEIQEFAESLNVDSDENGLLGDANGDGFIDMPAGTVLEIPTGQDQDEGLWEVGPEFRFTPDASPSLEDFLNERVNDKKLDPLHGVRPFNDDSLYPSLVSDQVLVSPIWKSDISDTDPWVNAQGDRWGLAAYKIVGVGDDPDGNGSDLPYLLIKFVDPSDIELDQIQLWSGGGGGGGSGPQLVK